jgi:hypothetical protein
MLNLLWFVSAAVVELAILYGLYVLRQQFATTTISSDLLHESMLAVILLLPFAQAFAHRRVLAKAFPVHEGENRYWVTVMPFFLYLMNVSLLMYWYGTTLSNLQV